MDNSLFKVDFLNYLSDLVIYLNSAGEITEFNTTAEKYYGQNKLDILGLNYSEFCKKMNFEYPKILENLDAFTQGNKNTIRRFKTIINKKIILWRIMPLKEEEKLTVVILIGKIISKSDRVTSKIKNIEARLKAVIGSIAGNHWWKDVNGRYRGCNDSILTLLGLKSSSDIIGKTDYDLPWAEQADQLIQHDKLVMQTGLPQTREEVATSKGGKLFTFLVTKVPLRNEQGRIIGTIGSSVDITELKQIQTELALSKERAEAANEAKSVFIANMSHDIRTPLSGIIGIAKILEKKEVTQENLEYCRIIHQASENLLFLLNDILAIVSLDKIKENNLNLETFSLFERIEHLNKLFSANVTAKKIKLEINKSANLPEYIVSDRLKIDRILINLVSNALKFTDKGVVRLSVNLQSYDYDKAVIQFIITDSGIGIPEDKIDKIFDKFYKISPSYKAKYTGYGIGLFMVKQFITLLHGKITVESELGKGTTVCVDLPVNIGKKEDAKKIKDSICRKMIHTKSNLTKRSNAIFSAKAKGSKLKVLLIEDDNLARHTQKFFLESIGLSVLDVANGEEGIKVAKSQSFDCIITDIGLPGINGNEFTLLFRHWEKKSGKEFIPIIGLSAHASGETKEEALNVGMNDLLEKPLNDKKIIDILSYLSKDNNFASPTDDNNVSNITTFVGSLGVDLPKTEAELFELEQHPLLNEEDGIEKSGGNKDLLREILRLLIDESIPEELLNFKMAYVKKDWDSIQKLAHKLKGCSLYCGTIRMSFACQYLERYRLAGHEKLLEKLYQQLIIVLEDTRLFVSNYLSTT